MIDNAVEIEKPTKTKTPETDTSQTVQTRSKSGLMRLLNFLRGGKKTAVNQTQVQSAENQKTIEEIRKKYLSPLSMARNASPSFESADDHRLELNYLEEIKQLGGANALAPDEFDRRAKLIALREADATHQSMSEAFEAEVRARLIKEEGYGQTIAAPAVSAVGATAPAPEKKSVVGGGPIGEKTPA